MLSEPLLIAAANSQDAEFLTKISEEAGYRPVVAKSGAEAIEMVRTKPFFVVFLSLTLADRTWQEVLARVLAAAADANVIVAAGPGQNSESIEALKIGAVGRVGMPANPDEIRAVLNRATERWQLIRETKHAIAVRSGGAARSQSAKDADALAQAKVDFISLVTHELRNPLAAIVGFSSHVLTHYDRVSKEQLLTYLEIIQKGSIRLSRMLERLADLTQLLESRWPVEAQKIKMADVVQSAFKKCASMRPDVSLDSVFDSAALDVVTDKEKLEKALGALFENALRFSPANGKVAVRGKSDGNGGILVSIADAGPGIPSEDREKIFEAFHKVYDPNRAPGTGLGLTITKGIFELLGGKIWLDEALQKGCVMTFSLPKEYRKKA